MFWKPRNDHSITENRLFALENEVKSLHILATELRQLIQTANTKYLDWLEEVTADNKRLRDSIKKKVEYLERKEDSIGFKDAMKRKLMGIRTPKNLNTQSDSE